VSSTGEAVIDAGYFAKRVVVRPDWQAASSVYVVEVLEGHWDVEPNGDYA
jgi:hypothetical protein